MVRSGGKWLVEVHDKIDGLEAEWSALVGQHNATPFQSYGFTHLFMRQLLTNGTDTPVAALVRTQDGRPVALFVMLRSRQFGLRWLRTDARPIDYCSPVFDSSLAEDDIRDIIRTVLAAIPDVDLLYCNRMPERFEAGPNPFVRLSNAARLRLSAWKIELAGRSAQDLAAARLPRYFTVDGVRVAFLGFTDVLPVGFPATSSSPGTSPGRSDVAAVKQAVSSAA